MHSVSLVKLPDCMKFFRTLIFLGLLLFITADVHGQTITIQVRQTEMRKVLNEMERQTNVRFLYNYDLKALKNKVDFSAEDLQVCQALDKLFLNSGLTYKKVNENLIAIVSENSGDNKSIRITGKVTGENGEPLNGVSVVEKGGRNGTSTNSDGFFLLSVAQDAWLQISYIGYDKKEVSVDGELVVNIQLKASESKLNDVLVLGYGQERKSIVTGAISSIKQKDIETVSSTRIEQALQGRTAGVLVLPTSGQPGAGVNMRIRGAGSNRNSNPLFIVDGVRASGIEYLDPSEIASIEILKDAASAAIYGAEGANGVVIITTIMGKKNTGEISYNGQYSQQSLKSAFIKMMDAQEYQQYLQEAGIANAPTPADLIDIGKGTNWLDAVLQTVPQHHHSLQFSGGSDKSTYLVGGTYFSQEGIVGGSKSRFDRYTIRFNGDYRVKPWLNIGNRLSYSNFKRRAISENDEFNSIMANALVMDPITPIVYTGNYPAHVVAALASFTPDSVPISSLLRRDAVGNLYGISNYLKGEFGNPVERIELAKGETVQNKIVGNVFAEIEPVPGWVITSRLGVDAAFQVTHGWTPTYWFSSERLNSVAGGYDASNNWYTWQWENFVTYKHNSSDHSFTGLGGMSVIKTHEYHVGGSYSGLFKEDNRFSYADNVPDKVDRIGSTALDYSLASFFGRVSYAFKEKYLLNASLRHDGSSKLAPGHQWKTYPAISAGWILTNENFLSLPSFINYAKLRVSWGRNGNVSSVGVGEWLNGIGSGIVYPDANGNLIVGAAPTSLANPNLTWESSEQFDAGMDISFLQDRLNLSIDYYKKTTTDLLTGGTAPIFVGNILKSVNAGNVENSGWELEAVYSNKSTSVNGLTYEIEANFSSLHNSVTYLDPNSPIIYGAGIGVGWNATAMHAGYPVWYFNGYRTEGIFQTQDEINSYLAKTGITGYHPKPGETVVTDVNGDKQISPADMTYIGNPHPSFLYGSRIAVAYKGVDVLLFIQGESGNKILMGFNRLDRSTANKPEFFFTRRWTGTGSTNTWFAPNASNPYIYNSDLMVFDGSFARIRQLQIGYSLHCSILNRLRIKRARVYVSLDNYFTFTKYPGIDPEGGSNAQNSIGIDRGSYPVPRKLITGLTFNF
jgi:TonB-linked SusC/RagA family outer membrane protein